MDNRQIRIIFRISFIILLGLIFIFVVYKHTNPFGWPQVYNYSLSRKINRFISPLRPKERLSRHYQDEKGDWVKDIKGPLTYFDLGPVRKDQKLTLMIKYRAEVPEVRFGEVLSAGDELKYNPHPFYNEFLQNLDWEYVADEQGVVLYQKEKHFESVSEYLNNVPLDKTNAVYFFSDERTKNAQTLTHFKNPQEEIDYIITTYQRARETPDGWLETTFHFNLAHSFLRKDMATYLFSVPAHDNQVIGSDTIFPKVTITNINAVIQEPPSKYWVRLKKLVSGV